MCKNSDGNNCQVESDAVIGSRRIRILKETVVQPQQCERQDTHLSGKGNAAEDYGRHP